jgi:deazaflavin-dependent oxidoreductase (nitroreductase family)
MKQTDHSGLIYRWMRKINPRMIQNYPAQGGPSRFVLLLTTIGRKSGLPRITPVQFEEIDGVFYIASARGTQADWYKNILACPRVEVRVQDRHFRSTAEAVTDPARIADFFEIRMRKNLFIGILMRLEGLPLICRRSDLERFAVKKTMVVLQPDREI